MHSNVVHKTVIHTNREGSLSKLITNLNLQGMMLISQVNERVRVRVIILMVLLFNLSNTGHIEKANQKCNIYHDLTD